MRHSARSLPNRPGRGAAVVLVSPSIRAVQPVVGTSVMPPRRPLAMRRRKQISPSQFTATKAAPCRTGFFFLLL